MTGSALVSAWAAIHEAQDKVRDLRKSDEAKMNPFIDAAKAARLLAEACEALQMHPKTGEGYDA